MRFLSALVAPALIAGLLSLSAGHAHADTPNAAMTAPDVSVITFHRTVVNANVNVAFALPFAADLLGVQAYSSGAAGTSPTLTVDLMEAGSSVLLSPITVNQANISHGDIVDSVLADEAIMRLDFTVGGTSPVFDEVTVLLTVSRR